MAARKTTVKAQFRYLGLFLAFFLSAGSLQADRVYLKNGRKIDGVLVGQSRRYIRLRVNGKVLRFAKSRIKRIQYGPVAVPAKPVPKPARKPAPKRTPTKTVPKAVKKAVKKAPPKVPAAKKTGVENRADKLRVTQDRLRVAEERIRRAEERIRSAEEKIRLAQLRIKTAEAKRLEATALAKEWEFKARNARLAPKGRSGKSGVSLMAYFLPGLGQWQKDKNISAGILGGLFALQAFNLYDANDKWKRERTVYENLNSFNIPSATTGSDLAFSAAYARIFENQQANIDAQYQRARISVLGLLLVYAWNYFDLSRSKSNPSSRSFVDGGKNQAASSRWGVDVMAGVGKGDLNPGVRVYFRKNIF